MIAFENTKVMNFDGAFRGMRNPLNSWDKSDSDYCYEWLDCSNCDLCNDEHTDKVADNPYVLGAADLALAQKLINAGSDHRKFLRQIFVSVDIVAPLYWWKEFDTYKVGTVANSCSTMHKIHSEPIELSDFSIDDFYIDDEGLNLSDYFKNVVADCESLRKKYIETKDKKYWRGLIQLLPTSYNQRRTVTLNYETLRNIYGSRRGHKLDEWRIGFIDWIKALPYAEELIIS